MTKENDNKDMILGKLEYFTSLSDEELNIEMPLMESEFSCKIGLFKEQHHAIQHTFYFNIAFTDGKFFSAEIENGVANGADIRNYAWEKSAVPHSKKHGVLSNIEIDEELCMDKLQLAEFNYILKDKKEMLFDLYKMYEYDKCVSGYYHDFSVYVRKIKSEDIKLLKILRYLKYSFETIIIDRTFI